MIKKNILFFLIFAFLITPNFRLYSQEKEEEAFYVAEKAFSDGFYEASTTLFEKFVHDYPRSTYRHKARLYIAKSFYFQKKYPEALKLLNDMLSKTDAQECIDEIYYWLGQVYFEGKNFQQALEYALRVINECKDSKVYWWSYYLAGECYYNLSQFNECSSALGEILSKSKEKEVIKKALLHLLNVYYAQEDFSTIISLVDDYLSSITDTNVKARLLLYKGEGFFGKKDFSNALKVLKEGLSVAIDVELKDIFYQRIGDCLLSEGQEVKAKQSFDNITSDELKQFSYANYYLKTKQYSKALAITDHYLEQFSTSHYAPHIYLNKADSLYEMGRIKDAIFYYKKILAGYMPQKYKNIFDKAHYGLAWCYLKVGEYKKAIDEFKKTLKFTDNPIVRISSQIQIADAYQEKEMCDLALETYNKILKEYPDNIYSDYIQFQIGMVFLKNNKLEEAKMSFRTLKKNFPHTKLTPEAEYYLAASYFSENDYRSAQDILEKLLQEFSKHPLREKAYYLYGKCFFNQAQYTRALDVFEEVIKESKNKEFQQLLYIDKAYAYLNLSRYEEAKGVFTEFIKKFPHSKYISSALLNLGGLCEKEKDFAEAERYYMRIIENFSHQPFYHEAMMALAHIFWERNKPEEAKKYFRKLSESKNENIACKAQLYLGEILAQEGKIEDSLKVFDQLIQLNKSISTLAMAKKGFIFKEMREYQRAASLFREVIAAGLDDPQIHFSLGHCLEKSGQFDEALREYFNIIYLFDDMEYKVKAYFRSARIYEQQNNLMEAKNIYKKIMALNVEEAKIAQERFTEIEQILKKTEDSAR